jgi:hypothetical protein
MSETQAPYLTGEEMLALQTRCALLEAQKATWLAEIERLRAELAAARAENK